MKNILRLLILTISALTMINALHAQWVQQNSGTNEMLSDVVMLDTVTAIVVGQSGSILRTSDAGTTWINVAESLSFVERWKSVSFCDAANGIIVGYYGGVVTTTNGGNNWEWHTIPNAQICFSVLQIWSGNIYVGADSGWIYHSVDTGTTWTSEKISIWPIVSLFEWRGDYAEGLPLYALTPYSVCSKVTYPPTPWNEKILKDFQPLGSAAYNGEFCNGGGAGFIVGVQGDMRADPTILRKSMGDTTWRKVSTGILRDGVLLGVSAPSADVIYACGSSGRMFKSTNGGDTWTNTTVPTMEPLRGIYFFDEKRGFAVGNFGEIFFTANGGVTGIDERGDRTPATFQLKQNYPNPFNPSTVISYDLPFSSLVTLKVYDLLGREVETLVGYRQNAGSHSVTFNAGNSPSGIYYYRLRSGTYSETKKFVLLR